MKAAQIKVSRQPNDVDTEVTFFDKEGNEVSVTLGPKGQTLLVSLLLSGAKGRVVGENFELKAPPIQATSFQNFVLNDNFAGLQIGIPEGAAIHVAFDAQAFSQLCTAVEGLKAKEHSSLPPNQGRH